MSYEQFRFSGDVFSAQNKKSIVMPGFSSIQLTNKSTFGLFFSIILLLFIACERDFSPLGQQDKIVVFNKPDTTQNPYVLTQGEYPDWSPTGDKLAFIREGYLWIYHFKRWEEERILKNAIEPSFSPDGKRVAFERERQIWIVELESGVQTRLCDGITPSWSENGKWIAYANKDASRTFSNADLQWGQPSPDSSLYYYDLESNTIQRVIISNYNSWPTVDDLSMFSPDWALQDSIIIFDMEFGIWKVKRTGGIAVGYSDDFSFQKKTTQISSRQPKWCEANQRLAFTEYTVYSWSENTIRDIRLDFLTTDSLHVAYLSGGSKPSWHPLGDNVAYYSKGNIVISEWKKLQ